MLGIASALERLLSIEDAEDVKWIFSSTAASIMCGSSCSRTKRRF